MVSLRPLALLFFVSVATPVPQTERGRCPDCTGTSARPVCGSNHVLYRNECYLQRAKCNDFPSLFKLNDGPCENRGGGSSGCRKECTKIYLPVCGSDGKTYNNYCLMELASCESVTNNRSPITLVKEEGCDEEDICQRNCAETYNPVCGTDRVTYYSKCDLSIAICRNDQVRLHHEGTCAGFSGRGARRPSVERSHGTGTATTSAILNRDCSDTCTGGFRPVCGTNNVTYGSDCHLEVAICKDPTLRKRADGVCTKDCFLQCDTTRELVCGTDGVTYTNDCFLLRARCKDSSVRREHDGPCEFVEKAECRSRRCGTRGQAMCGSDGITYRNQCLFDAAVCYNQGLLKLYEGPCRN